MELDELLDLVNGVVVETQCRQSFLGHFCADDIVVVKGDLAPGLEFLRHRLSDVVQKSSHPERYIRRAVWKTFLL